MNTRCAGLVVAAAVALLYAAPCVAGSNPAAPGFDASGSDAKAIELADRTMEAMGGRAAWERARVISWSIFKRSHVWDKWTGDYRLEADSTLVIMNLNTQQGRVWEKGVEVTDAAKRDPILKEGMSIWINDSYWLVMPYKLKDTGVTLRYLGEQPTQDDREADAIQLTFAGVGDTPENKYVVWIDRETDLVTQWAYYEKNTDDAPQFTRPWSHWTQVGDIKISMGRGRFDVVNVHVSKDPAPAAFTAPAH